MKKTFDHAYKLTLTVRTESGAVSLDVGLQGLTRQERKFLHDLVRRTHEGGAVGFGVDPTQDGSSIIKLTLMGKENALALAEAANSAPT